MAVIYSNNRIAAGNRPLFYGINWDSLQAKGLRWLSHFQNTAANVISPRETPTSVSGVTWTSDGALFDADADYIDFGDITTFDGWSAITVSAWIKIDNITNLTPGRRWLNKWNDPSANSFILAQEDGRGDSIVVAIRGLTYFSGYSARSVLSAGSIYHVVWVWDTNKYSTTGGHTVYVNGKQASLTLLADTGNPAAISLTATPFTFGRDSIGGNGLLGKWYHCAIYNRALTSAEIWTLYDPSTRWNLYWQPSRIFDLGLLSTKYYFRRR